MVHQCGYLDVQGLSYPLNIDQRHIVLSPLDSSRVGTIQAGKICQGFLGEVSAQSELTNGRAERHEGGLVSGMNT